MPNIKLQSSDGVIFDVDIKAAKCSGFIKTLLEDSEDHDEEKVVRLPKVNSVILKKVIQWVTYHKDDPLTPEDDENNENRTDDISSWDADFLNIDQDTKHQLMLAAMDLDIKGLEDITCTTVEVKGITPAEFMKMFK